MFHHRASLLSFLLILAPITHAQPKDPLQGTFKDDQLSVTLTPADNGGYTGTLTKGKTGYPLAASARGKALTGSFTDGKNDFPFTATFETGELVLKSGTGTYRLARVANPLDDTRADLPPIPAPSPKDIEQALKAAKAYLYSIQKDGNWDLKQRASEAKPDAQGNFKLIDIQNSSQWGGITALATYALLAAGENPQDPRIAEAVNFLKSADIEGTYALGCRALVWNALPNSMRKETLELAKRDRDLLLKNQRKDERCHPLFRYLADNTGDTACDHSASQFAVLGLWAADQLGAEVSTNFWKETDAAWLNDQDQATGGWAYSNVFIRRQENTPSMTAAGVATLFITNDMLRGAAAADCRGNVPHKAIDAGVAWLVDHSEEIFDLRKSKFPFYTLYGVERIGLAGGYKYLGTIDWYKTGAAALLAHQNDDGSWGAPGGTGVADTCFAILFLARGRAPLVLSKLQYDLDQHGDKPRQANWNQRPRDAANLARWLGRSLEREINWQIVNLKVPAEDLHDAPILYLAGNQTLSFTAAEEEKLRQFALQGGLILGNADCTSGQFGTSFKKLGAKLFPPYEFRELPAGHLIYNENFPRTRWKNPPQVQGLSNGARELMILIPNGDAARFWQTNAFAGHESLYELLANLFLYCSERQDLRFKGDSWLALSNPEVRAARSLKVARLQHDYNWNPEPAGWPRLAAMLHNRDQLDLTIDTVKLGEGKIGGQSPPYKIAHLTTTGKFRLKDDERAELKSFISAGGNLLVDAAAGDGDAATTLEAELTSLFNQKPQPLPLDHALYKNLGQGADQITYRPYARKILGQLKGPRLRAITIDNRSAIFFSPEDLSVGLVGHPIDGVVGYTPQSAAAIVRAILLSLADR